MPNTSKTKAAKAREKVAKLRERLEKYLEEGFDAEEIAYLGAIKMGYSERNAQLIAMQAPEATVVRGFKAWLEHGRCVRKGEAGIAILAPAGKQKAEEPSEAHPEGLAARQFFRIAYVFDISQTDLQK